ncbi:alpha/beta fold hydrolase [Streptomyces sp. or20]|uniref:alpha/beta fold hydrolase n=1 Tax=Streptomyces sp. or20 TaxID=1828016 RepID=UPI000BF18671|nr:alpha/beta fold hydrolase [Streptomyces sp. or20]
MTVLHSRDHGGDGPLLLLLHGAGRSSADWAAAAPQLAGRHRVLAVDLPGHGRSAPAGSWDFAEVCADLDDTLAAAGSAGRVAVAGHSLGGMVASVYAATRPDRVAAAVDLDGFGWGRPDQYPGVPEEEAARRLAEIGAMSRAAAGARMPAGYVADQVAYSVGLGVPRVPAEETCRACVRELPGGEWQLLPERPGAVEMLDAMDGLGLFAVFRRVSCPLLLVRALDLPPMPHGPEWMDDLLVAYGRGLDRDLAALAAREPRVVVEGVAATHAMLLQAPERVASLVGDFLARSDDRG